MALDPHINPASGVWDDNFYANTGKYLAGGGNSSSGGGGGGQNFSIPDPVETAKKLLNFQIESNQPQVAALSTQQGGLDQKYKDLVASIKGNQQLDTDRQTTTTNNLLAGRGLSSDSGVYQQELTNSLTPINVAYSGQFANANAGSISDQQNLALQIAQLQSGDPNTAAGQALQYGGLVNSANQLQSQNAYNSAQLAQNQQQFSASQQAQLSQQAIDNAYRQTAYNNSQKNSGIVGNPLAYLQPNTSTNTGAVYTPPSSFQPANTSTRNGPVYTPAPTYSASYRA